MSSVVFIRMQLSTSSSARSSPLWQTSLVATAGVPLASANAASLRLSRSSLGVKVALKVDIKVARAEDRLQPIAKRTWIFASG